MNKTSFADGDADADAEEVARYIFSSSYLNESLPLRRYI